MHLAETGVLWQFQNENSVDSYFDLWYHRTRFGGEEWRHAVAASSFCHKPFTAAASFSAISSSVVPRGNSTGLPTTILISPRLAKLRSCCLRGNRPSIRIGTTGIFSDSVRMPMPERNGDISPSI